MDKVGDQTASVDRFDVLLSRLRSFRDHRDWKQFHNPKDLAISVSVEAAELLELFQWRSHELAAVLPISTRLAEEAADVFLYLALLCDSIGIDLLAAANEKIDQNESRFPIATSRGVAKHDNLVRDV